MELRGKIVLITGASSGIGEALARDLGARGASLSLLARRKEKLDALAAELEQKQGIRAVALACDVTAEGDLERAVAETVERFGQIDVVVANAGFGVGGALETLTLEDYRRQFETNVFGVLRTIYASLDALKRSRGTLVLMGSIGSYIAGPGSSPYTMSKFAIRALADALRGELAAHGVGVVLVNPGFIESDFRRVDNAGVLHEGKQDPIPPWLQVSAEDAARDIVRAVRRGQGEHIITGHGKVLVLAQRLAPRLTSWALAKRG